MRASENRIGLFNVAEHHLESDIAGRFLVHLRRAGLAGGREISRHRQGLPFNIEASARIAGEFKRIGHDEGHRIAHMAHGLARQNRVSGRAMRWPSRFFCGARQGSGPRWSRSAPVRSRHAGHGTGLIEIPDAEGRMREGRAQHEGACLALRAGIGGIMPCTGDESLVLDASERLSDTEFHGGKS